MTYAYEGVRKTKKITSELGKPTKEFVGSLIKVMSIQSKSNKEERMIKFLEGELKRIPNVTYELLENNFYIVKKTDASVTLFPAMVAHMDTVHDIVKDFKVFRNNNDLFAFSGEEIKQTGIGGDDKCGIFITLELLHKLPNMKAAFFWGEEIGCKGSRASKLDFWSDASLILQCDRKGNADFIKQAGGNELSSKEFVEHISEILCKYDYAEEYGASTDVVALKDRGLDICVANMSTGYYAPHSPKETVNIQDVWETYHFCLEIFEHCGFKRWEHKKRESHYSAGYSHYQHHGASDTDWQNWQGGGVEEEEEEETSVSGNECTCGGSLLVLNHNKLCSECLRVVKIK